MPTRNRVSAADAAIGAQLPEALHYADGAALLMPAARSNVNFPLSQALHHRGRSPRNTAQRFLTTNGYGS